MKKSIKIFALFVVMIVAANGCFAMSAGKIDKHISASNLDKTSTVAISVKVASTGRTVYERNSEKLLHPASTLKVPTAFFAVNTLGYDYFFKTQFYTDNKNLYIKLGADPELTTSQLKSAFKALKEQNLNTFDNLYIDDSIIDKKEFSQGWMWDDDVNPFTPKVSAYNLDENVIKVNMSLSQDGTIKTSTSSKYPMSVFSYIQKSAKGEYFDINRYNWNNPELVEIYGYVAKPRAINVPISSMRRYFIYNVDKILDDERIIIKSTSYSSKIVPKTANKVYEILNPIEPLMTDILQNSNNLMAETIYKLAGGSVYQSTGSDEAARAAMADFYKNIKFDNVIIRDGCGVSRNNLVSADWMTDILTTIYKDKNFEKFKEYMAQPGDGTLSSRLYDLRGNAWLKTGSLANVSAISGYVNSLDGNTYVFTMYTQNFIANPKDVKNFEDEIITLIYNR